MGRDDHPLRKRRDELELRLVDVAERAGVSIGLLSMLEGGYTPNRNSATLERVAAAVASSVERLWPEQGS